jgi:Arc/MetJ-type ribon-helix-helix transcriptional regulator
MKTVNISIPDNLASQIDLLLGEQEYASRSEVVRTALRIFFTLDDSSQPRELSTFQKRPLNEIENDMREAGHPPKLIDSVLSGLKKSSFYK